MSNGTGKGAYDLCGKRFGRLTVIERAPNKVNRRNSFWKCQCDCGRSTVVIGTNLVLGRTHSCGCLNSEIIAQRNRDKADGKYRNPRLYNIYYGMRTRCYNSEDGGYHRYGERGIRVCDEWLNDYFAFQEWALSHGYQDGLTLDRIDFNGDYEPNNCRWATAKMQANNRRTNVYLSAHGETHTVSEWSQITGISMAAIYGRLRNGWSHEDAVSIQTGYYIGGKYNYFSKRRRIK